MSIFLNLLFFIWEPGALGTAWGGAPVKLRQKSTQDSNEAFFQLIMISCGDCSTKSCSRWYGRSHMCSSLSYWLIWD